MSPARLFAVILCSFVFAAQGHAKDVRVEVRLGDPVVISQAPPEVRGWGPWQFPHLERLSDGRLHADYHVEADSATSYGKPVGHAVSADGGKTWKLLKEAPDTGGFLLPNGDRIRPYTQKSIPAASLKLPKPIAVVRGTYGSVDYALHPVATLPPTLKGYRILRATKHVGRWTEEFARVSIPEETFAVTEGVFAFAGFDRGQVHWRLAPDGSLWAATYSARPVPEAHRAAWGPYKLGVVILRSTDQGRSWNTLSEIPYQPADSDVHAAKRDGFSEPDVSFLPDGSAFCLIRTTDGLGPGPLYSSRSTDSGKTWSKPAIFDDLGVWPVLLTLKNGVTLAAYGRPGLFVRASVDPSARTWNSRATVVPAGKIQQETCSYVDLLALDDHTALMVYSDFNWPDANGVKRKTIIARTVTAKRRR